MVSVFWPEACICQNRFVPISAANLVSTGIPKLEDANDAGGRNSQHCTLILTEGDSAKTLAVAGLSVVGRDRFGVFPLRCRPGGRTSGSSLWMANSTRSSRESGIVCFPRDAAGCTLSMR